MSATLARRRPRAHRQVERGGPVIERPELNTLTGLCDAVAAMVEKIKPSRDGGAST